MPGAEGWLLPLPAPGHSAAFGPCVLLLPPKLPPPCPQPRQDLSSGHKHQPFGNFPGAAVQQLSSHAAQAAGRRRSHAGRAGQAGGGWEMLQEHRATPCHRHPIQLGQAGPNWGCPMDAKGTSCLCLCFCPTLVLGRGARGWGTPQLGPGLSSGCKPRAKRGRAGSWLSPKVAILTRAFSFTRGSAWEQGSHLSTVSLTSEPKHPQGPHRTPPIH